MRHSFRARTLVLALVALSIWAVASLALPLVELQADATLFGLPLRIALALLIALPVLVLVMFWFAAHQNLEDGRFRDDG